MDKVITHLGCFIFVFGKIFISSPYEQVKVWALSVSQQMLTQFQPHFLGAAGTMAYKIDAFLHLAVLLRVMRIYQ